MQDEFVVELFVTLDKVQTLIQNLIAMEVWKDKVYPRVRGDLLGITKSTSQCYFLVCPWVPDCVHAPLPVTPPSVSLCVLVPLPVTSCF